MHEEIAEQRNDVLGRGAGIALAIVGAHRDHVSAGRQVIGDVEAEPAECALVLGHMTSVHPDIGDVADAVELQEMAFARR